MIDVDKLIRTIEGMLEQFYKGNNRPWSIKITENALKVIKASRPHLLTVREVKRLGADNMFADLNTRTDEPYTTVVWLEENGKKPVPVKLVWDEDGGEYNDTVDVYFFGTDLNDNLLLTEYGAGGWRCWSDRPTETQRMAAAWNKEVTGDD